MQRGFFMRAALAAAIMVPGAAVCRASDNVAAAQTSSQAAVTSVAPDFSRKRLTGGDEIHLGAYRGKVVLLNFWATWCSPCLSEIPHFAQWQTRYGRQGLQIIGVSMDDDEAPVRTAYAKFKLNYPVVMGDARLAALFGGIYGLPVTLLIDRRGTIRYRHKGEVHLDAMSHELETLLAERPR